MAIARFKDLCIDANDPALVASFWAGALGLGHKTRAGGKHFLVGSTDERTVWINDVPERRSVKSRVHLDVLTTELEQLTSLGARLLQAEGRKFRGTVMADPEGTELCAFLRTELPPDRLQALVVDCADATSLAAWWSRIYDADVVDHPQGYSSLVGVAGLPAASMDFVPVPEAKTVKNRVHWDVTLPALVPLLDAGARLLRQQDDEISWHVMADPEGNEFCAFIR